MWHEVIFTHDLPWEKSNSAENLLIIALWRKYTIVKQTEDKQFSIGSLLVLETCQCLETFCSILIEMIYSGMALQYLIENKQGHYNSNAQVAPVQEIMLLRKSQFGAWRNQSSLFRSNGYSSESWVQSSVPMRWLVAVYNSNCLVPKTL